MQHPYRWWTRINESEDDDDDDGDGPLGRLDLSLPISSSLLLSMYMMNEMSLLMNGKVVLEGSK